jgi:hypothetical protein
VKWQRSQVGLTLLEIMLVLVVATSVVLASLKQIQVYMLDNDIAAIKANVDNLFSASGLFYRTYCSQNSFAGNTSVRLLPSTLDVPSSPVTSGNGFLTVPLCYPTGKCAWYGVPNNIVNTSDSSGGYIAQFNSLPMSSSPQATMNTACNAKDCSSTSPGPVVNNNLPSMKVVFVTLQVSVLMKNVKLASYVEGVLGADCLSTENSSTPPTVNPCTSPAPAGATWVVFTRLPAFASPESTSALWPSMARLKEFNMQYTHDQMYELMTGTTEDTGSGAISSYTCGE